MKPFDYFIDFFLKSFLDNYDLLNPYRKHEWRYHPHKYV